MGSKSRAVKSRVCLVCSSWLELDADGLKNHAEFCFRVKQAKVALGFDVESSVDLSNE